MRFLTAGAALHFREDGLSGADNNSAARPKPVNLPVPWWRLNRR